MNAIAELPSYRAQSRSPRSVIWRSLISTHDADPLRALLAESASGNRQAFEALYRSVSPRLHGIALRFMGRSDLAEEVLQEAFVRIWYNASRYEAHLAAPMTWMVNITRNLAIDQLRKRREQPLADGQQDALPDDGPSAHEQLDRERGAQALSRCLDSLDAVQRQSISVAYFKGLSCTELAEHMAAPLGSVKSWIRRGMERLRRCLES
ncbi:sigma-70 family RNA polymerase sigma factor [Pseudomonas sp. KBW05]|jgi:RNA polymerase sigma factor (sigma-70 family)|uniref:sigma-70 family RNA polymerase sigma factor n=1 Tax=Pseudomonas sp. KBW05 TaxID=2153360 RepID=UPI000F59CA9A|nr:sigma-70 family RNA polymerase sigma factor [Pseudomonas sp. KBW05]RQO52958.1 RNA polymerase subunit sigma-70 [Pseudomonas sp. KBW05]